MHFKFFSCVYIEDLDILVLTYIGKIVLNFSLDLHMKENDYHHITQLDRITEFTTYLFH